MYFYAESMRQSKRKTQRVLKTKNVMQKAMKEVLIDEKFCRTVANKYDISHETLRRYCLNCCKEAAIVKDDDITEVSLRKYGYFNNRSVFNISQELLLVEYLLKASALYYGLSTNEVKSLAYEYAAKLGLKIPNSWVAAKKTGTDWLSGFMKRHPNLTLRTSESRSLSRATSFNRHNVRMFFMTNMNRFCKGIDLHQTRFETLMRLAAPQYRNQEKLLLQPVLSKSVLLFRQREVNLSHFVVLLVQLEA